MKRSPKPLADLVCTWQHWMVIDGRSARSVTAVQNVFRNYLGGISCVTATDMLSFSADAICYPVQWSTGFPVAVSWRVAKGG